MESITLQQFLELLYAIANYIIPILLLVVLIYISLFLHRLSKVLLHTTDRVKQLEKTIELVDKNLESLVITTNSVANVSASIDKAHEKSIEKVKEFSTKVSGSMSKIQEKSKQLFEKNENLKSVQDKLEGLQDEK